MDGGREDTESIVKEYDHKEDESRDQSELQARSYL